MAEQFKEQGGAATMDPSPLRRWLMSRFISRQLQPRLLERRRSTLEQRRLQAGQPHVVEYFHQVEDGYSHLAAQLLRPLVERYDIRLVCHLVRGPEGRNAPEPERLLALSRYDALHVATEYGLAFPVHDAPPDPGRVRQATAILAAQDDGGFIDVAAEVGRALWADDSEALAALANRCGCASDAAAAAKLEAGTARRSELKHYSGAMFCYAGEWYWGVDRLYHLEQRLAALGADRRSGQPLLVPRPAVDAGPLRDDGRLTLEIYPSLRSPYTSISFDRAIQLARDTGVRLVVRPVLPMVMRGVPATREKGIYIFTDTAREARETGVPFGPVYDPIGDPVRRCYSLYPWACEQGRGNELLSSFLRAAWAQGINTNNDRGLRRVVENAGLDWTEAKSRIGRPGWEELVEQNRLAMYAAGLWGVPSFRLLDENGEQRLALWGQDRLWLFSREIQRLLACRNGVGPQGSGGTPA